MFTITSNATSLKLGFFLMESGESFFLQNQPVRVHWICSMISVTFFNAFVVNV